MFEWKVEDMTLLNQKSGLFLKGGKEKIYNCEHEVSREDKIDFVDKMQDGKLSYLLELIEKFDKDKETIPKDQYGYPKTVSLKAWIKRNDVKYSKPIIDDWYRHGTYNMLGTERTIYSNEKGSYDTYDDLVDEVFHRQLKKCEVAEIVYFEENDEYSILLKEFIKKSECYSTTFGVPILITNRDVLVGDFENNRKITIEELKELLSKYEQLDILVSKLTSETHITC